MRANTVAMVLMACGLALHTYTALFESSSFHVGFWLWSLSPYLVAAALVWRFDAPHVATGALVLPLVMDLWMFHSVFIRPESSTAALGLLFAPLWNLLVLGPLGGAAGWWIGKERRDDCR